ncbi:nucleotidyltransferase domain-containing protein [Shimazuella sp. AN120528]|uniref:nucleotidyltransferase domain-containing protein n=1 Tax=Shimazuella soli TaxID=1892854 RepID=UPI001F10DEF8|nr:nucleotidyltransferase domain-containing protein [Shimazuella soli]MCH5584241.1 nucleotidyltransferase domain-containing protein [Shimazuella soli]
MSIINEFTTYMTERFDSIKAIVIFGSYARREEKEGSDLDAYLIFEQVNPILLKEVGEACRGFFPRFHKEISYPMCLTTEDFYHHIKNGSTDPIKYFEAMVVYGELPINPPSKEKVSEFCCEIIMEAILDLRSHLVRNETNVKRLMQVVKTFAIALKLERYLTTGKYPKTLHKLRESLAGSELEVIPQWFEDHDLLQENLDQNREDVIQKLFLLLNRTQNSLGTTK